MLIIASLLVALCSSFAQAGSAAEKNVVKTLPDIKLGIRLQRDGNHLHLTPANKESDLDYRPPFANFWGLFVGYKKVGATIYFGIPTSDHTKSEEGKSNYHDVILSSYFDNFGFEFRYTYYKGLFVNNSQELSSQTLAGEKYLRYPDFVSEGFGLNLYYALNGERFSMSDAFEQTQVQKKSGGSWLITTMIRSHQFRNSGPIIPAEKQQDYGKDARVSTLRMFSLAPGIAYSHLWRFGDYFVSPYLGASFGYQSTNWLSDGNEFQHGSLAPNYQLKLGTGWNSRMLFVTGDFQLDRYQHASDSIDISNVLIAVIFSVGMRFN